MSPPKEDALVVPGARFGNTPQRSPLPPDQATLAEPGLPQGASLSPFWRHSGSQTGATVDLKALLAVPWALHQGRRKPSPVPSG